MDLQKDISIIHFKSVITSDEEFDEGFAELLKMANERARKADWNFGGSYPLLQHQLRKIIGLFSLQAAKRKSQIRNKR